MGRYTRDSLIRGGKSLSTNQSAVNVRRAIARGDVDTRIVVVGRFRRLDHIAHDYLGDASLWWVIAAASGIGWGLQVPEGTRLVVPVSKEQLGGLI